MVFHPKRSLLCIAGAALVPLSKRGPLVTQRTKVANFDSAASERCAN